MGYDFDPNPMGTILRHLEAIGGRPRALMAEERLLFGAMFDAGQAQVRGGIVDSEFARNLNKRYLIIRAELAQIEGDHQEAQRLESLSRGLKGEREKIC